MSVQTRLQGTRWLAKRLGLSVSTIERLRSENSLDIPPHVRIGNGYRYDELYVEYWLEKRLNPEIEPYSDWKAKNAGRFL